MAAEYLMLAEKYVDQRVGGYYCSEKLDGTRAFWDGGVSRDINLTDVPYANIWHPKTGKLKSNLLARATGLWSRYGNPIVAPDWWLDMLPKVPLDGELWCGRGNFQSARSIIGRTKNVNPNDWKHVQYAIFDMPSFRGVFGDRQIKGTQCKLKIESDTILDFMRDNDGHFWSEFMDPEDFNLTCMRLDRELGGCNPEVVYQHRQVLLPKEEREASEVIKRQIDLVLEQGGEGLVLRAPSSIWTPARMKTLLKVKPFHDAEATIVGYTSGAETNKGSKLLGKIGALRVKYGEVVFELAGMTDREREFETPEMVEHAAKNPGEDMPDWFNGKVLKVGDVITFRYTSFTDDGIPREARFLREA